jgi:hypothetical protein
MRNYWNSKKNNHSSAKKISQKPYSQVKKMYNQPSPTSRKPRK